MPKTNKEKFKAGIYNYCDRWCERCSDTNKCYIYAKEQEAKQKHIEDGEDPNDPKIMMKDIITDMREVNKMIQTKMNKLGVTEKELGEMELQDINAEPDFDKHPLIEKCLKYFESSHKFLSEFNYEQQKMVMQFGIKITDNDIDDELKIITWYHSLLGSKATRLLIEQHFAKIETDPETKKIIIEDLPKFFSLINKCISQSQNAFNSFTQKREGYKTKISPLIKLLTQIQSEVDKLK